MTGVFLNQFTKRSKKINWRVQAIKNSAITLEALSEQRNQFRQGLDERKLDLLCDFIAGKKKPS